MGPNGGSVATDSGHWLWVCYVAAALYNNNSCAQYLLRVHHIRLFPELGTRSFIRGSLSAPHSIFSHGSLTLLRSFFEFPFSLRAPPLVAQPVVRSAKKRWITHRSHEKIGLGIIRFHDFSVFSQLKNMLSYKKLQNYYASSSSQSSKLNTLLKGLSHLYKVTRWKFRCHLIKFSAL